MTIERIVELPKRSKTIDITGSGTNVAFTVPLNKIAYLHKLEIKNEVAGTSVDIRLYDRATMQDGDTIVTKKLDMEFDPASSTQIDELDSRKFIGKVDVTASTASASSPVVVTLSSKLR